jgi:non-heme chloroperoxidase
MAETEPTLTTDELAQVERAVASGRPAVVFVHGLWLLGSSWQPWRDLFEEAGYTTVAPGWPDDPATVGEGRAHPEGFAGKTVGQVTAHFAEVLRALGGRPAVVGHSFGGLITQKLAGQGLSSVSVAVDPAPFRGVLPLPLSALKASSPVLSNPANRKRAVMLTFDQFRYGFANAVDEAEAKRLYDEYPVPGPGAPLFQAAFANFNPKTEASVDTMSVSRGPLKILSGEQDNIVPWAIANASYKKQARNIGVTEIQEIPGRGHSLILDHGWREVAEVALSFVQKNGPA